MTDARSMRDRMLSGDLYKPDDPELQQELRRAQHLAHRINTEDPGNEETILALLRELLGALGDDPWIRPPVFFDYGARTSIGDRVFINFGLVVLDVAQVSIGDDVLIGPNVQLLTAVHPTDPILRRDKWESAKPIVIGDNAWLGGGVIVCPGVTIGANSVVGAGSVVVKSIPDGVVAVGNPARVVRRVGGGDASVP